MTLDGPSGTILAAMGTAQDHTIAGSAISQSIVSGAAPMSSAATLDGQLASCSLLFCCRIPAESSAHMLATRGPVCAVRALANEWRSAQRSITSGGSASATAQPREQVDYETQMALADPARQASFAAVYECEPAASTWSYLLSAGPPWSPSDRMPSDRMPSDYMPSARMPCTFSPPCSDSSALDDRPNPDPDPDPDTDTARTYIQTHTH